jgi:hypothetical protein
MRARRHGALHIVHRHWSNLVKGASKDDSAAMERTCNAVTTNAAAVATLDNGGSLATRGRSLAGKRVYMAGEVGVYPSRLWRLGVKVRPLAAAGEHSSTATCTIYLSVSSSTAENGG